MNTRNRDSIDRLTTSQIILRSKNGSVKIVVDDSGNLKFSSANNSNTGSFSIDLKNEKISTKKIEFIKDNSSFTSSLNVSSADSSNSSDTKFDPSTGRLIEDFLPSDFNDIRDNALEAIGKFDPSGLLKDINLNQNLLINITKGVTAHDKFDITGKLPQENIHDSILDNIVKGVTAHGKFDADGRLPAVNIHTDVMADITKGVTANGKFGADGRLPAVNIHADIISDIGKGITAHDRFDTDGKLPSTNIHQNILDDISKGVLANSDLLTTDISIDTSGKIQFNRGGSRGSSIGTTITKSHIGLPLVENKSVATIKTETFADSIFTTIQSTANTANTLSNTIEGRFSDGLLKATNAAADLRNSNISIAQASSGQITLTLGTSIPPIAINPLSTTTFTSVQTAANTANTLSNTIEGRFTNNLLNTANASADLRNSNLSFAQGSDGTITLARGEGLSSVTVNPLSTTTFTSVQTAANTANSTANTINNRFDDNGRIKLSNLTQGSINTNLLYKNNAGLTVNWYTNNAQPQPTTVFNDSLQVHSIATTNIGSRSENFLNGTTYVESVSPINDNGYLGGADGKPFFYLYSKNGEFTNTLTVNNSLGVSQTNILAYQPINLATAGSIISGFVGDLTIKQPVLNTTSPGNNNTNAGIVMQRNASTSNAWRMFVNDNADFVWTYTGVVKGYIADNAGGGSLNFTGQHRNIPAITEDYLSKIGLIVVSCGEYASTNSNSITINEALPKIKLSTKRNEKSVFGVISNKEDENSNTREFEIGNFVSVNEKPENDNRLIINSIGEGAIWVCNIDGNFENGDYITSCEIPGYGMKQSDDLLHNYTVAKITCHCDFNLQSPIYICEEFEYEGKSYRRAFVGCTYHCG